MNETPVPAGEATPVTLTEEEWDLIMADFKATPDPIKANALKDFQANFLCNL